MEQIARAIKERQLVVFAGAGISMDADLPDWLGLGEQLYKRLSSNNKIPEDSKEIARQLLSKKETFPTGIDFLNSFISRFDIGNELREILTPKKESLIHEALKKLNLPGFVTTNYDRLLDSVVSEHSFRLTNSIEKLKLASSAINNAISNLNSQFLLKLHGDIDDIHSPNDIEIARGGPFMVLSNADYSSLVQGERGDALRLALYAILQRLSVLFIGYGFGDPDINFFLDFLTRHCKFSHPSWFIGLDGSNIPALPNGITVIKPIKNWEELPAWLTKFAISNGSKKGVDTQKNEIKAFLPKEKRELQILAEFLNGLESEDLLEKTIASILVNELLNYEKVTWDWIVEFISDFLEIGHDWATVFAKATIPQLIDLKLVEEQGNGADLRVIKARANILHQRAISEYNEERKQFFESIKDRMDKTGIPITDIFITQIDAAAQHICMCFGQRMAEWIHIGSGKEFGMAHIREIVPLYFKDPQHKSTIENLFEYIFDSPTDKEILYLYRLLSSSFLLNSIKLDPSASKFLKDSIAQYELYLDSNILLPLIVQEHNNNKWISSVVSASNEVGANLFVLNDILEEVFGHRDVAREICKEYHGNRESLTIYAEALGNNANCFIQGYLNTIKSQKSDWKEYLNSYNEEKIRDFIDKKSIKIVTVTAEDLNKTSYVEVLNAIRLERRERLSNIHNRYDKLNIDEAKQFIQIYKRRKELIAEGKQNNVWFLSYETVFEKIYQTNPSKWGKPPTFPFSAWATFLDSRLLFEHRDRKNILTAILKGNSAAYNLPDSIAFVRKKAFGNQVLSKGMYEAFQVAISDGKIFGRVEKALDAINRRKQKTNYVQEYKEATEALVTEIHSQLGEEVEILKKQLIEAKKFSSEVASRLEQEIENLKAQLKRRKRHKRHKK